MKIRTLVLDLIRGAVALLRRAYQAEPARVVAYGGTAALGVAAVIAGAVGVVLPSEVTAAVQVIGVFIATEIVRRLVTPVASQ